MSFYGNVSNASKTQLVFDRIYANRAAMDEAINKGNGTDGVFVNRLVLIEYDDNTHSKRQGFLKARPGENGIYQIFAEEECNNGTQFVYSETNRDGYGMAFGDIVYVRWPLTGEIFYFQCWGYYGANTNVAAFKKIYSASMDDNTKVTDYLLNYYADKQSYPEMPYNGYDSTIWKKSIEGGREIYQMIGSLNSDAPHFSVAADAPSVNPMAPHMGENSTNQNYTLHIPTNWGFKVKPAESYVDEKGNEKMLSDESVVYSYIPLDENNKFQEGETVEEIYNGAIYYNKAGFDSELISKVDEVPNEISVLPTGKSGRKYFNHGGDEPVEKEDLQELKIHLPALGNAISDMWDVIYGGFKHHGSNKRNKSIGWNNLSGLRLVKNRNGNGYDFDEEDIATVAGCINSIHDLMGMIISTPKEEELGDKDKYLQNAQTDRIYYGPLGQTSTPGFFYKGVGYTYTPFKDNAEKDKYIAGREYFDLEAFQPAEYYTYLNRNFYLEMEEVPKAETQYFKLSGHKTANVKEWQPIDIETGDLIYSYYKTDIGDYIEDTAENPSHSEYYSIVPTQATIPSPTWEQTLTQIWNPSNLIDITAEKDITSSIDQKYIDQYGLDSIKIYQGYFYMQKDGGGNNTGLIAVKATDTYDPNKQYYYLKECAVVSIYDASTETTNQGFFFIKNRELTSFLDVITSTDYNDQALLYGAKVTLLPYRDNTYFTILAEDLGGGQVRRGYQLLQQQANINNESIYYTLEVTQETGTSVPGATGQPSQAIYYYQPAMFYLQSGADYVLALGEYDPGETYLILLDKDGKEIKLQSGNAVIDAEQVNFYVPGEYYYRSKQLGEDVLDYSVTMKTAASAEVDKDYISPEGYVYYHPHLAYVYNDSEGILAKGSVWDRGTNPPASVTLASRTEIPQWYEFTEFARSLNTIHGLILRMNKIFEFDNDLTRDRKTVQGCLNSLNDLLNQFDTLDPGDLVIVDEYGRLTGADFTTDNWIAAAVNDGLQESTVSITHKNAQAKSGNTIGFSADATPKFGATFKGFGFDIDAKGHVIANNVKNYSVTMPSLAVSDGTAGNVVTSLAISGDGQSVVANKSNVGSLTLTGYSIATAAGTLLATDTLNTALGKLEFRTKALEDVAGEANVQVDWNVIDTASDAYILNKPDLTGMVKTTSTFTYGGGQKTIQELMTLVATLEAKVAALENPPAGS